MPRAAIDIGSQSVLLTVLSDDGRVLHDEARIVRLGTGLGDRGMFRPDRMEAARAALVEYAATATRLGVPAGEVRAAATSAARRALNADTFFRRLQDETGLKVTVISGEEEARLTWAGALHDLALPDGPVLVIDLGGGSTELVLGERHHIHTRVSLELGAVRLTESFPGLLQSDPRGVSRLREHVDAVLSAISLPMRPRTALGVAGTATTLAAMDAGLSDYDPSVVHGYTLTRLALRRWIDALLEADTDQRRALAAVDPERADYLLAGTVVLDRVLEVASRQSMKVSARGLRFGLLED